MKLIDSFVVETDFSIVEKRLNKVEKQRNIFDDSQFEIEQLVEDPNHEDIRTEFEERFYSEVSRATILSKNHSVTLTQLVISEAWSPSSTESQLPQFEIPNQRKLPSLNLPVLNGNYETWLGYLDLFKSLVYDDGNTSNIEKFYYLKGCLHGEAQKVIASLVLSAEKYKVAWDLLRDRYDNRKAIHQSHVKSLLNLPCITREVSIRSFLDQAPKHIRALKALNEPVETLDILLVEIITLKLILFPRKKWVDVSSESTQSTYVELI